MRNGYVNTDWPSYHSGIVIPEIVFPSVLDYIKQGSTPTRISPMLSYMGQ